MCPPEEIRPVGKLDDWTYNNLGGTFSEKIIPHIAKINCPRNHSTVLDMAMEFSQTRFAGAAELMEDQFIAFCMDKDKFAMNQDLNGIIFQYLQESLDDEISRPPTKIAIGATLFEDSVFDTVYCTAEWRSGVHRSRGFGLPSAIRFHAYVRYCDNSDEWTSAYFKTHSFHYSHGKDGEQSRMMKVENENDEDGNDRRCAWEKWMRSINHANVFVNARGEAEMFRLKIVKRERETRKRHGF